MLYPYSGLRLSTKERTMSPATQRQELSERSRKRRAYCMTPPPRGSGSRLRALLELGRGQADAILPQVAVTVHIL